MAKLLSHANKTLSEFHVSEPALCGSNGHRYSHGLMADASFLAGSFLFGNVCPRCVKAAAKRNGGEQHHFLLAM